MTFIYFLTIILFLFLCVLLCGVILMQEGQAGGLGASLGGGDAGESVFGTGTATILKTFTAWLAFFFFLSCIILSLWTSMLERVRTPSTSSTIEQIESR